MSVWGVALLAAVIVLHAGSIISTYEDKTLFEVVQHILRAAIFTALLVWGTLMQVAAVVVVTTMLYFYLPTPETRERMERMPAELLPIRAALAVFLQIAFWALFQIIR